MHNVRSKASGDAKLEVNRKLRKSKKEPIIIIIIIIIIIQ